MCRQSLCRQSLCRQSLCRQSMCRQSMCRQSMCRQSMCRQSLCRQSLCRQSMCRQSMCRQSKCRQSLCRQSMCRQSMLIMLKWTSRHSFPYLCLPICLLSPSVRTAVAFTVIFTEVSQCPTPFFVGHVSQGKHHSCNLQWYHIVYKHVRSQ